MRVKQIYFTAPKVAQLLELDRPTLRTDDVLVAMEYTVVSGGTERACLLGMENTPRSFPMSLGYCGVGVVQEMGSAVDGFQLGDRVLVYHGCHASHNVVKQDQLTLVDDASIPSIEAAFVIIASMALGGVRKTQLEIGESAMVMGQGLLGVFATQLCRLNGANPVIAVDSHEERRQLALQLGADYAFDPSEHDFVENVKSVTRGKGVNVTIEVTGVSAAMKKALDCTAWMGRIALLGCTRVSDCAVDYYQQVHRPGVTLIGAHNFVRPKHESYPHHWTHHDDCTALLDLLAAKRLQVAPLIAEVAAPENAPEIYTRLVEKNGFPVGVVFDWRTMHA
ncbi:MAG TPA: zinc-binding alcohol dehydrogenase [Armatimonadota bacterium]|nr:zinc-binding alcohol dehydrogenase [Armatimonadota bacterium]